MKNDSLTGYTTRTYFDKMLKNKVEMLLNKYGGTIVLYDVNGLKYINKLGYDIGDKFLQYVTKVIKNNGQNGLYIRWGGDEFVSIHLNRLYIPKRSTLYTNAWRYIFPGAGESFDEIIKDLGIYIQQQKLKR